METEEKKMEKLFFTKAEAEAFVEHGKSLCSKEWNDCELKNWHIEEVKE